MYVCVREIEREREKVCVCVCLLNGDFRYIGPQNCQKEPLRSGILAASTRKVHRPRSQSPLHLDTRMIQRNPTENKTLALGVRFPYPSSSAGRTFPASRSSLDLLVWNTGWRRLIGCLKLQVIFRKRAANYRALLRKITHDDACNEPYN